MTQQIVATYSTNSSVLLSKVYKFCKNQTTTKFLENTINVYNIKSILLDTLKTLNLPIFPRNK
jgi:hypothetical protein